MIRVHSSFHKCLTMYFKNVMQSSLNHYRTSLKKRYVHHESIEGVFYNRASRTYLNSTNSFAIDIDRLDDDFRATRFIRDPRDLVVSGYFYHKRAAEPWFRMKNPTAKYWSPINGNVPKNHPTDLSFAEYLNTLDTETGLEAEIEFRQHHLQSFRDWPDDDRIKIFKYEEIIGNEIDTFKAICEHLQLSKSETFRVLRKAKKLAYKKTTNNKHIRNPKAGQWREHFTKQQNERFVEEYADILERHDYELY